MPIIKTDTALMCPGGVPRAAVPLHVAAATVIETRAKLSAFAVRTLALVTTTLAARAGRWWRRAALSPGRHVSASGSPINADGMVLLDALPGLLHIRANKQAWILDLLAPPVPLGGAKSTSNRVPWPIGVVLRRPIALHAQLVEIFKATPNPKNVF